MAKNEIVNVLTIKTEESQKTIKGLKKEISDLKKILDNAVIGSDEFEKASKDLAAAQNTLKSALNGNKQTTEALAGSYDALVAEMAELKKEWRATADEAKRNDLGVQIDNINNQLKELDATIGNNQRKVGAYAEEFGKALEKNNDSVAASANEFKRALAEQDDATISTRTKLESLQKVATGLASGYAAVQGVMTLLNIENEELQKAMVKVQSAMAIAQGVGGLKDFVEGIGRAKVAFAGATNGAKMFIGGLSGVKKAIIGTGIGALVVAIGLLIANWDKLIGVFKKDNGELDKLENSIKDLKTTLKSNDDDFDYFIRLQEAAGKSREEILKLIKTQKFEQKELAAQKALEAADSLHKLNMNPTIWNKDEREKAQKIWEEAEAFSQEKFNEWLKAERNLTIYYKEEETKRANDAKERAKEQAEQEKRNNEQRLNRQKEIDEKLRLSKLNEEEKLIDELDKKYLEYIKVFEENQEKQLEILTWYTDEYTKIVEKGLDEQIAAQKKAGEEKEKLTKEEYEKRVAASEKRLDKKLTNIDAGAETQTYLNERQKPKGNGEINAIDNELSKLVTLKNITNETLNLKIAAIDAEMALFEQSSERWKELEEQKILIREQANRTLNELDTQLVEQTKAKQRALAGSITSTFTAALSSASSIIGALQEGIDTTTKEGFEKNKKMQIANATIQMLVGITSALAGAFTTKSGPWDIALAAIQAATIATTGGIQIANIKKQTFEGAGSGSTPSVSPSLGMGDSLPISYTRNLMTDTETEEMNKAQRVYILESDIEESGKRVEIRENNTDF